MSPHITEICIVANLQSTGPIYIGDTDQGLFDTISGSMLAARLIITAGMGNSTSPTNKLHGPVPIPELSLDKDYICYFYLTDLEQESNNTISNDKGSYITCIIIPEAEKESLRLYEKVIEAILLENALNIKFSSPIPGQINKEAHQKIKENLQTIKKRITESFELAPMFEGSSLYDIGLIGDLPDDLARLAKKLILHPKGLAIEHIENTELLKTFQIAGLITIETRDEKKWIVPK